VYTGTLRFLRPTVPVLVAVALLCTASAAASLQPVRRAGPRLRAGTIALPAGHADGRVRVVVRLAEPPLAALRRLQSVGSSARLDTGSRSARAYLAQLARAQASAAAALRRAIPEAVVQERFRIVLDGLAVSLPARSLPRLTRLPFVTRVYPSARYTLATNRNPQLIGADALAATTGARGDGIKIGVVDDGIDQTNPFFAPDGFSYPAGFPKGETSYTTPKVIVARVFPGPNAGKAGNLPLDPASSFHGTHVAGIAAGDAGTNAPAGADHPAVSGLTGVAPRAFLGNYRVFTVPTPIGHVANTPEIIAAFEAAVADGMDVINFSGGGAQTDPANDAMIETVRNVAAAGVVPVIAAGNDRDDFGLGTVGSPGTAPEAITVAAVSNDEVFAPTLAGTLPGAPTQIPYEPSENALKAGNATLVDVGSVVAGSGVPVERHLCGAANDPNGLVNPLARHSLDGAVVLVSRGICTFTSKARRAAEAGAVGILVVDNRAGEANRIPVRLAVPGGMVADLDGARLRAYVAPLDGRAPIQVGTQVEDVLTGRGGVLTSFSSAGPSDFGHALKPDLAAPGGQILSSTLGTQGPFAVFDGTSMATPHVAGAAALLRQLHPGWSVAQVKSALVSTAGPAYGDSARTTEASVLLEGGGLANLPRAADPKLFTEPASLSLGDLDVNRGAASSALLIRLTDAGGGAGLWTVGLTSQSASAGATVDVPGTVSVAPGGEAELPVVARAAAGAAKGDDYGFVVLSKDGVTRRIPYAFFVTSPALAALTPVPLRQLQTGTTIGDSHVSEYRWPAAPFGPPPAFGGPPMHEDGAETLYVAHVNDAVANAGVAVVAAPRGVQVDPWFLGSPDENDVQGQAGTPVDVNNLTSDFKLDIGAAGVEFPRQQAFYVSLDSGRDQFTGQLLAGSYTLRFWIDDVTPPRVRLLTTRVAAGRPTIVARVRDAGAGVDPLSLTLGYKKILVGAAAYDPETGLAVLPLPAAAPALVAGTTRARVRAADFQEAKNVNTSGSSIFPNTRVANVPIHVVNGPAITWLGATCTRLLVTASSTKRIREVRFEGVGVVRRATLGLYSKRWHGKHARTIRAVVVDAAGRTASSSVRACT
jgi:minor extracellular serine protease Vpr